MAEGDFHFYVKDELYRRLSESRHCRSCAAERTIGAVRPDVSLYIKNKPVAIEIQHSALHQDTVAQRMSEYGAQNINVLWVLLDGYGDPDIRESLDQGRYPASALERYLHAMYYGRVYYYHKGLDLTPVHFDPHVVHVPAREGFNRDGDEFAGGGYNKKSKRFRVMNIEKRVNIVKDFGASFRGEFSTLTMNVPACRLWIDRRRKWW